MANLLSLSSTEKKAALSVGLPVALLGCYGAYRWFSSRNLPPGPIGLPIIGNLASLDTSQLHLSIADMSREYGNIVSFRLGTQLTIAVCSYDLVKDLLNDENYLGRPRAPFLQRLSQGCGIFLSEGDSWLRQRQLALTSLRRFGFAGELSAEMVNTQLDVVFQALEEPAAAEGGLRVLDAFMEATNAVIAKLTLNRRFDRNSREFQFFNDAVKRIFDTPVVLNLPIMFPFLDFIVRLMPASNAFTDCFLKLQEFIRQQIRIREAIMIGDAMEPECLCDVYIMEKRRAEQRGDFESFKELQIIEVILDLFLAGTDTTARSLEWLLILMATHPDVQHRVNTELDREVGRGRRPQTSDKQRLKYTYAVIEEAFRFVSLAAIGVFHRSMRDSMFHGYRIPAGAIILPCVHSVNHDGRVWQRPDEFYPEHFLSDNGDFVGAGKSVPFLLGRRSCLGEGLARMEIFLMFSAIMQRYRVSLAPEFVGLEAEIVRGSLSTVRKPGQHRLLFELR